MSAPWAGESKTIGLSAPALYRGPGLTGICASGLPGHRFAGPPGARSTDSRLLFFEDKPHAANGMEQAGRIALIDRFPEVVDVDVDDVRACVELISPHLFRDRAPREDAILVSHEKLQERKLFGREADVLRSPPDAARLDVNLQVFDAENRAPVHAPSAEQRFRARDELCEGKRLGKVIIRPRFKSLHPF